MKSRISKGTLIILFIALAILWFLPELSTGMKLAGFLIEIVLWIILISRKEAETTKIEGKSKMSIEGWYILLLIAIVSLGAYVINHLVSGDLYWFSTEKTIVNDYKILFECLIASYFISLYYRVEKQVPVIGSVGSGKSVLIRRLVEHLSIEKH